MAKNGPKRRFLLLPLIYYWVHQKLDLTRDSTDQCPTNTLHLCLSLFLCLLASQLTRGVEEGLFLNPKTIISLRNSRHLFKKRSLHLLNAGCDGAYESLNLIKFDCLNNLFIEFVAFLRNWWAHLAPLYPHFTAVKSHPGMGIYIRFARFVRFTSPTAFF